MQRSQPECAIRTPGAVTAVRRFSGPVADEVFVVSRPDGGVGDAARQAETVYEALVDALGAEGLAPESVVSETVFFRRIREDAEAARAARSRVLGGLRPPATTCIGQPPLDDGARLALSAVAVRPRDPGASSAREVRRTAGCTCEVCAPGLRATVFRVGDETSLYAGNVHGTGRDAFEEASEMFRAAERLLAEAGMRFDDVVRTWIHIRDIDRDYDALNAARRECFRRCGLERRPASTGVQGIPFPDAHAFSLSLWAVQSGRPLGLAAMSTPSLNEAWSYGADFSRGLRIADANQVTLHVSGTASIDEAGRTAHVGDFRGQAERMLHNIASLLARQGAGFAHVVSAVAYLRNPDDAPALRATFRERGFDGFPCAVVEARLCRPELLCETEAVAILPLTAPRA